MGLLYEVFFYLSPPGAIMGGRTLPLPRVQWWEISGGRSTVMAPAF